MSSYGLNFEFRIPPAPAQRNARYVTPATGTPIKIGAPVEVTATEVDEQGRLEVVLATGATPPQNGITGILVYEYAPSAGAGSDPFLTTFSSPQFSAAPLGAPVQLVSGGEVKVVLRNTTGNEAFAGNISATGLAPQTPVVFVAPGDLTGLQVGDMLAPGTGTDAAGYWAETATAAEAWLVITSVDPARGEVEARMTF